MLQNANFPNFKTTFKAQLVRILRNAFIIAILAYSGPHICLCFQISSGIKEVRLSPGNNVSDKPLTPQDARLSCGQFDVNYMFVR